MLGDKPLSSQARELLAQERGLREDEGLKARALERAQAAVPGERTSSIGLRRASDAPPKGKSRRLLRTLPLIAASFALVSLAVASVAVYRWQTQETAFVPSEQARLTVPRAPRPVVASPRLSVTPDSQAPSEPATVARPEAAAPSMPSDGARSLNIKQYAAELALLEPARSSIGRGDYAAALTAISQHRREFPSSQLSEEREALRIRALWGLGQKPAALSAAKSFRKHYPRSSLLSWLPDQSAASP